MMTGGFRLGRVLGFEVTVDYSWFIIFFLVVWSFSSLVFPVAVPGRSGALYLLAGMVTALLLFVSLLGHELSHAVVARAKGIPVDGITLFIFGGIARTRMEASSPGDEFQIAGVGPLASFVIALLFGALAVAAARSGAPPLVTVAAQYLSYLNLILAIFNLLPGFPLDGGRLFRALVWKITGNLTRATRIATIGGQGFGFLLVAWGLWRVLDGAVMNGAWLILIGWFLRSAAVNSYRQHIVHVMLEGATARHAMTPGPQTVAPDASLRSLVDDFFSSRRYGAYPVTTGDRPHGIVTLQQVRDTPADEWDRMRVADVMTALDAGIIVAPEDTMTTVLEKLRGSPAHRVLVVRDGRLEGIVTARDVASWLERGRA